MQSSTTVERKAAMTAPGMAAYRMYSTATCPSKQSNQNAKIPVRLTWLTPSVQRNNTTEERRLLIRHASLMHDAGEIHISAGMRMAGRPSCCPAAQQWASTTQALSR